MSAHSHTLPLMAALSFLTGPGVALAHQAPSGWAYSSECCGNADCRPAMAGEISETGASIIAHGQSFPANSSAVKMSPDGEWHICLSPRMRIFCIYRPFGGT